MYKVIIADDENMIRLAMEMMIDWESNGFQFAGTAKNGRQAADMAFSLNADLVITDIRMPEMDGLELISWLKQEHFHGAILILSNYDDFELVRTGLRSGAYDYLLKVDLNPELLTQKIQEIKKFLDTKDNSSKALSPVNTEEKNSPISLQAWSSFFIASAPDSDFPVPENCRIYLITLLLPSSGVQAMRLQAAGKLLEDIKKENPEAWILKLSETSFLFIDSGKNHFSTEVAEKIENQLNLYLNLCCHVIYTGILKTAPDLFNGYRELHAIMDSLFYTEESVILRTPYHIPEWGEPPKIDERSVQEKLSQFLLYGDYGNAEKWLDNFISIQQQAHIAPEWIKGTLYHLLNATYYVLPYREELSVTLDFLDKGIRHAETVHELRSTGKRFFQICQNRHCNTKREVLELMAYIDEHLREHLTLTSLRKQVNLSEKYMCTIFKRETGTSIINYINEKRIRKAAELLTITDMRLKEIGEAVGIPDPFYFSKMFKKYYHVTPSQFRSDSFTPAEPLDNPALRGDKYD